MPHSRRIFLLFSLSLLFGVIFGVNFWNGEYWIPVLIGISIIGIIGYALKRVLLLSISISLLGFSLGAISGYISYQSHVGHFRILERITQGFEKKSRIEGTVEKEISQKERSRVVLLRIDTFDNFDTTSTISFSGFSFYREVSRPSIFVEVPSNLDIEVGERIAFDAKIRPNITFPLSGYDRYAFHKGGYGYVFLPSWKNISPKKHPNFWKNTRTSLAESYHSIFPRDVAGVILGMTVGYTDLLSPETKKAFIQSGISHILVVSGSNIAFVILFLVFFLKYIPTRRKLVQILVVTLFLLLYGMLVSWEVSVLRATIMGILTYTIASTGNRVASRTPLALAIIVLSLSDPLGVLYDAGFALSFGATLGIILCKERVEWFLSKLALPKNLAPYFSITLGASIGSIPALVYHFGTFSPLSIIANILIAGVLGWILFGSVALIFIAKFSSSLGFVFGYALYIPVKYLMWVGNFFASFPSITFSHEQATLISLFLYGVLIMFFVLDD